MRIFLLLMLLSTTGITPVSAGDISSGTAWLRSDGTQIGADLTVSYSASTAANTVKTSTDITSLGGLYHIICLDNDMASSAITVTLNNKTLSFNGSDQYVPVFTFSVAAGAQRCVTVLGWMPSGVLGQIAISNDAISDGGGSRTVAMRMRVL